LRNKLSLDTYDQIVDHVALTSALEPVTMTTLRMMKSEAIRSSKALHVGSHRAYDHMTCFDLVHILHLALRRRVDSELALSHHWASNSSVNYHYGALTDVSVGCFNKYGIRWYQQLASILRDRVCSVLFVNPSLNIPLGSTIF
jgi:hypothetical protein